MKDIDEKYMRIALKEAKKAQEEDEVPVGCILVKDDKIIARAHNKKENSKSPLAHGEILAIQKACKKIDAWRLNGVTLYVTLEPCPMCAGAILESRIDRVVYGVEEIKSGALGSSFNLFEQKNLNHHPIIKGGVLKEECKEILTSYFKNKRNKISK